MVRTFPTTINVANNPKHKLHTMFHELKSMIEAEWFLEILPVRTPSVKKGKFECKLLLIIDSGCIYRNVAYSKNNRKGGLESF